MKIFNPINTAAILLSIFSCSSPVEKILNLENVGTDFNVSSYYQKKLDKTTETIAKDPAKTDKKELRKLLDGNMFVKDTLCFYTSERFEGQYIDSKSDYMNRNKAHEGIYGFTYNTVSWDENDSLAVLNGVYFQTLDMLENKDGKLLSLKAMNESKSGSNYLNLVNQLKKKYGTPKILLKDKAKNLEILDWETDQDKIQLSTKIDTVENVLSISIDDKKEIRLEPKYTIDYFKISKKYLNDLKKLKSGKWFLSEDN